MDVWISSSINKLRSAWKLRRTWIWIVIFLFGFWTGTLCAGGGQGQIVDLRPVNNNNEQLPFCGGGGEDRVDQQGSPASSAAPDDHGPAVAQFSGSENVKSRRRNGNRSAILVSTIDGRITALNATDGSTIWSHATKPESLLSSTLDNLRFTNEGKRVHLVPSLDGDLFTFDGDRMGSVPLSMDALLSNSMRVANDTVVGGGKEIRTYGIDRSTGRLRYDCGSDGCNLVPPSIGKIEVDEEDDEDVVVVRRLTKTVRAISARTGLEKWNYSVAIHEVSLASSPLNEGCHDQSRTASQPSTSIIKFMASDGVVLAQDFKHENNWKRELSVPIVHAWQMNGNELVPLNLFDEDQNVHDESSKGLRPVLHVGMYNEQLYVLQSPKLRSALQLEWDTFGTKTYPLVTWKPYLISAHSRTPIILGSSSTHLEFIGGQQPHQENTALVAILEDTEYPYDGGFTLYTNGMSLKNGSQKSAMTSANYSTEDVAEEADQQLETLDQIIIVSLWYWWKEVLVISISFAVFTNVCITRHVLHRMTKRKFVDRDSGREIVVVQPTPSCVFVAAKEPIVSEMPSDSQNSSESLISTSATVTPPVEFVSRYSSDFEPIQKLGKGGFGVVVQARNKLDDCEYAIKRICMPNKNDRKARIMREVKALAKLDHISIVRYYNAWLECPPSDWQDNQFSTVDQDVFTPSSSMTCDELHSLYGQRGPQQQNPSTFSSWSKPTGRSVNNNEKSFTISLPSSSRRVANELDDSLNIVFEDSGCKSEAGCEQKNQSTDASSLSYIQSKETTEPKAEPAGSELVTSPFVWEKPEKLYLYIQMQLCRKDNLKDWLNFNKNNRDKFEVLDYFHQIVSAVEYVHEQGLIHRDLKPSNIFFAQDGSIKVGDFGLAASTTPEVSRSAASTPDRGFPTAPNARHTDQVGTGLYMSPEQVAEKTYDHKVDIFSLGLIFFEMLVPFVTAMERVKVMMDARQLIFPSTFVEYSPDELQLASKMLAQQPQDRLSASDIKQHSLLQDFQPRPELLRRHRRGRNVSRTYSNSSSSGSGSGSGLEIIFDQG